MYAHSNKIGRKMYVALKDNRVFVDRLEKAGRDYFVFVHHGRVPKFHIRHYEFFNETKKRNGRPCKE